MQPNGPGYGQDAGGSRTRAQYAAMLASQQKALGSQIQGIRDFLRARSAGIGRPQPEDARRHEAALPALHASTPEPGNRQTQAAALGRYTLPTSVLAGSRSRRDSAQQPQDEQQRSMPLDLAPPSGEADEPGVAPSSAAAATVLRSQPAQSSLADRSGGERVVGRVQLPEERPRDASGTAGVISENSSARSSARRERHVSVRQPMEDVPVVPGGNQADGGDDLDIGLERESARTPTHRRSPPPPDGSVSPRVHSHSGQTSPGQRDIVPTPFTPGSDSSRRTAALQDALAVLKDTAGTPLTHQELDLWRSVCQAMRQIADVGDDLDDGDVSPPNASKQYPRGIRTMTPSITNTFRSFQRLRGGPQSPLNTSGGNPKSNSMRSIASANSFGAAGGNNAARRPSNAASDSDSEWLEVVLRFTTRCTEQCGGGDRSHVARALQSEVESVLSTTGLSATVWVPDRAHGLLVNYSAKTTIATDEDHVAAMAFSSGQTQRVGKTVAHIMVASGTVVGVLEARPRRQQQQYTMDEVEMASSTTNPPPLNISPNGLAGVDADSEVFTIVEAMAAIAAQFLHNASQYQEAITTKRQGDLMLRMARMLSTDALDETTLVMTIIRSVSELIEADRCSVFVVSEDKKTLRAFFEDKSRFVEMPIEAGFAGHVARTGDTINIDDAYSDPRFNAAVDRATGYRTRSVLCMPVSFEGRTVAVAQLVNKRPLQIFGREIERTFTVADEALFNSLAVYIGVCLRNCRANAKVEAQRERNETALRVASMLSRADIRQLSKVIHQILQGAKALLHADRATLFLVDKEKNDLFSKAEFNTEGVTIRVKKGSGIVGQVAKTGKAVNVPDAYADSRFNKEVDKQFGYRTVSIIAEPIHGPTGEVIAVAQLINKIDRDRAPPGTSFVRGKGGMHMNASHSSSEPGPARTLAGAGAMEESVASDAGLPRRESMEETMTHQFIPFTDDDHAAFKQFALFAGMALSNANLLEFAVKAAEDAMKLSAKGNHLSVGKGEDTPPERSLGRSGRVRSLQDLKSETTRKELEVALEITVTDGELSAAKTPEFNLFKFRRAHGEAAPDKCVRIIAQLIWETGLPVQFGCDMSTLLRFVLACRARYRNVPYHNWYHAVDVCQTVYHFLYVGGVSELLEPLDCFVLLIVALAHDLDHMGLNNSYHFKTESPLGILSSASGNTSVLEVHHCNLAIEILDQKSCDVFGGLTGLGRAAAVRGLIDCILATDMAKHNELLGSIEKTLGDDMKYDKANDAHRRMAMLHVTKAADISNVTKPFDVSRLWGASVTEEFYRQGDAEKAAGVEVLPMNDRSLRTELAKGQLGFINFMARKYFTTIVDKLFPQLHYTVDGIEANTQRWQEELELSEIALASGA